MRILQYLPGLPPIMVGGMIKYALDLTYSERKAGHEVIMLTPGHFTHFQKDRIRIIKKKWNGEECYRIINSLPVSGGRGVSDLSELIRRGDKEVYVRFLGEINPDVIHIHSFMGLHVAFLEAAAQLKIPIVYTTHDYYGICPKAILLKDMKQCTVTDGSMCSGCIHETMSVKKLKRQQSMLYELMKNNRFINLLEYSPQMIPIKIYIRSFRKKNKGQHITLESNIQDMQQVQRYKEVQCYYREMFGYVTRYHYNSNQSEEIFTQYLGKLSGNVIPISNRSVSDRRKKRNFGKTLRIGFIGRGDYKGFNMLRDALDSLYEEGMRDLECHVYFNPKEKLPSYIISHAPYKEDDVQQVYDGIDVLVLPSVWKETYGLVVLEALSFGVPVIVSQNVGAKELLKGHEGMGMIINSTKESLYGAIKKIYNNRELLSQMNLEICNCEFRLDFEEHVRKIIEIYYNK